MILMKKSKIAHILVFIISMFFGAFIFYIAGLPASGYSSLAYYSVDGNPDPLLSATCALPAPHFNTKIESQCNGYSIYENVHSGKLSSESFCQNKKNSAKFQNCRNFDPKDKPKALN